jgi:hypothetical protein
LQLSANSLASKLGYIEYIYSDLHQCTVVFGGKPNKNGSATTKLIAITKGSQHIDKLQKSLLVINNMKYSHYSGPKIVQ